MDKYKVLNLYACLGGNRLKWDEVAKLRGGGRNRGYSGRIRRRIS